ncbi:MAG: zinc-dependent alcohol dehydrogenase family protein [Candidatus Caldatribacteriota bacterium]
MLDNNIKAAVLEQPKKFKIDIYKKPNIGDNDILLKIVLCGICGSDVHFWKGTLGLKEPIILGHEFIGEIAEIGNKASEGRNLKVGDMVAVEIIMPCYQCEWCKNGIYRLCAKDDTASTNTYGRQFGCNIPIKVPPTPLWGGFAQYLFIPGEAITHKFEKKVEPKEAVLTEPFATAIHAIERAEPKVGESCVIFGPGTIGLCLTVAAKLKGLFPIILIGADKNDESRLKLGKELGADYVINLSNIKKEPILLIRELVNSLGVDISIDASGSSIAQILALRALKRGGRNVMVGISNNRSISIIPDSDIVFKEITIYGSILNKGYSKAIKLIENNKISLKKIVTHEFSLDDIEEAFIRADSKEENMIKVVINPWKN